MSFLPEAGALEPGQTYNIHFHLEKLWADVPSFIYPIVVKGSSESGAILVPDNGRPFRVKQLTLKDGRIDVVLSRNPANAALQGMVELEGAARSYTEVQDSLLRCTTRAAAKTWCFAWTAASRARTASPSEKPSPTVLPRRSRCPPWKFPSRAPSCPPKTASSSPSAPST